MSGTVSTSLTPLTGPGLAYTAIDEDWTIAPGVLVASNNSDGVHSDFAGALLTNYGSVVGNEDGVSFTAGGTVMNGVGGLISGLEFGVLISGGVGDTAGFISNAGQINGNIYAIGLTGEGDAYVNNSGAAIGLIAGVLVSLTTGDARIVNSGTMEGSYYGLAVLAAADKTVTIFNSGVIKQNNLIAGEFWSNIGVRWRRHVGKHRKDSWSRRVRRHRRFRSDQK